MNTYSWATDAASGEVQASDEHAVLDLLVAMGEWAAVGSARERADIADGAYLMIGLDAPGERLIARGVAP